MSMPILGIGILNSESDSGGAINCCICLSIRPPSQIVAQVNYELCTAAHSGTMLHRTLRIICNGVPAQ